MKILMILIAMSFVITTGFAQNLPSSTTVMATDLVQHVTFTVAGYLTTIKTTIDKDKNQASLSIRSGQGTFSVIMGDRKVRYKRSRGELIIVLDRPGDDSNAALHQQMLSCAEKATSAFIGKVQSYGHHEGQPPTEHIAIATFDVEAKIGKTFRPHATDSILSAPYKITVSLSDPTFAKLSCSVKHQP